MSPDSTWSDGIRIVYEFEWPDSLGVPDSVFVPEGCERDIDRDEQAHLWDRIFVDGWGYWWEPVIMERGWYHFWPGDSMGYLPPDTLYYELRRYKNEKKAR